MPFAALLGGMMLLGMMLLGMMLLGSMPLGMMLLGSMPLDMMLLGGMTVPLGGMIVPRSIMLMLMDPGSIMPPGTPPIVVPPRPSSRPINPPC